GAERRTGIFRRTDEIRDREAARLYHLVAEPAHSPSLLHTILLGKSEIPVDVRSDCIRVEVDRIKSRDEKSGQCRLPGAGKAHHEYLAAHDRSSSFLLVADLARSHYCVRERCASRTPFS